MHSARSERARGVKKCIGIVSPASGQAQKAQPMVGNWESALGRESRHASSRGKHHERRKSCVKEERSVAGMAVTVEGVLFKFIKL
jgi:hypothetical protein